MTDSDASRKGSPKAKKGKSQAPQTFQDGTQASAESLAVPPAESPFEIPAANHDLGASLFAANTEELTQSPPQGQTEQAPNSQSPSGEQAPPLSQALAQALSQHEEELLYAYSPTLGRSYEMWKVTGTGERMPRTLQLGLREWRSLGCPKARTAAPRLPHVAHAPVPGEEGGEADIASSATSGTATTMGSSGTKAGTADTTSSGSGITPAPSPLLRPRTAPPASAAAKKPESLPLPGIVPRTPGETAPMSNYLARTSLFAPIRKGRRFMHDKQKLHSPEGLDVLYSGKQLDMADQDVYLTALRLAGGVKPGDRIVINRAAFLRMLGYKHNPGARDYKWLEESFYRISTGRVLIEAKHIKANLPLIGALLLDERSGDYYFTIPRETYALWAKNLYSYIDLEKRNALTRNVPLSKWLQSYAQSHAPGQHIISMDLLHQWCGYGGRLRDFRESLTGALDEITRVGILKSWSIAERGTGRQKKLMISWVRERTHRDDTASLEHFDTSIGE